MLMQQHRSSLKSHTMARHRPMTAGRIMTPHASLHRTAPHALPPRQTFGRVSQRASQSSGTLLPWADPYIADLQAPARRRIARASGSQAASGSDAAGSSIQAARASAGAGNSKIAAPIVNPAPKAQRPTLFDGV